MRRPPRILSFAEYARISTRTPYVVDVAQRGARLVLFGGRHSSDPGDPMFAQIEAAFADLRPAHALHEGTPPALEPDREIAIRRHGEAGWCVTSPRASIRRPAWTCRCRRRRAGCGAKSAPATLVYLVVRPAGVVQPQDRAPGLRRLLRRLLHHRTRRSGSPSTGPWSSASTAGCSRGRWRRAP
ncbi:MAG: hypothetical protein U0802_15155 [Candidatus Binatia bacterium]